MIAHEPYLHDVGFDVAQGLMSGDSLSDIAMNSTGLSLASDAAGALGALSTNLFCFPGDTPVLMADGDMLAISDIRLGDRVQTVEEAQEQPSSPDISGRLNEYRIVTLHADGDLEIRLIERVDVITGKNLTEGSQTPIELKEMGISGTATVMSIERLLSVADGPGRLVTATFSRTAGELVQVWLGDDPEPILVTRQHPFFVANEQGWVKAGDLHQGDQLLSEDGETIEVSAIAEITGTSATHRVHTLEVDGEHRFFAGAQAVMVHNLSIPRGTKSFQKWFNKLSSKHLDRLWSNKTVRGQIEERLRRPGKMHEWLPVSRAPIFKKWGVTSEQIMSLRTPTRSTRFKNPSGYHGGRGSKTVHLVLFGLIDNSSSFEDYVNQLRDWADRRFVGGAAKLPKGLRP